MTSLTHLNSAGEAHMVDVAEKPTTQRRAVATGNVWMSDDAFKALEDGSNHKGDVLAAARIAGIMGAKKTSELIPLCHNIRISAVRVEFTPMPEASQLCITAEVIAKEQTGVEMEALTAVSIAALTIYDMLKSVDRSIRIGDIELLEKDGGQSGHYQRRVRVVSKTPDIVEEAAPTPKVVREKSAPPVQKNRRPIIGPEGWNTNETLAPTPGPAPTDESIARANNVRRLDPEEPALAALLRADPITSAYMLGDLDRPSSEHCKWYGLDEEGIKGILLLYTGLSMPAVLTKGDNESVGALLEAAHAHLPRRFYCHIRPFHQRSLECYYELSELKTMIRMGLSAEDYQPLRQSDRVEMLTHRDTGSIMHLYQHYPDNFFEPALLDTGLYFGMRDEGELVSVAGLHVLSKNFDVAAIGNIVTHSSKRGQGLATHCVGRLLEELFKRVNNVSLNVRHDNQAAIACYKKFGFTERYPFVEGWASTRRS